MFISESTVTLNYRFQKPLITYITNILYVTSHMWRETPIKPMGEKIKFLKDF